MKYDDHVYVVTVNSIRKVRLYERQVDCAVNSIIVIANGTDRRTNVAVYQTERINRSDR